MPSKTLEQKPEYPAEWLHEPVTYGIAVPIEEEGVQPEHLSALLAGHAAVMSSKVMLVNNTRCAWINPDKTVEPRRSAHEVGFGALVQLRVNAKGKKVQQAVAFKPFAKPHHALHEVDGYLALARLGIETFEPIGVFPSKSGDRFVVVTYKRNDLTSLDRDKWVIGRQVTDAASEEIAQRNNNTVAGISKLLGFIHSRGIFHPDGQIKNYAKTPKSVIGIIDTENLIVAPLNEPNAMEHAWQDIEKLIKSLIINTQDKEDIDIFGVGMLAGMPLTLVRQSIEDLVITPYLDSLAEHIKTADTDQSRHISGIYEGVYERFFLDEDWPTHLISASRKY